MMDDLDDLALVARYRDDGSTAAFNVLFDRYGRSLMAYLVCHAPERSTAEEIFQDVWVKAVNRISDFTHGSFKSWITTIARNALIDFSRKKKPSMSLDKTIGDDTALVDVMPDPSAGHPTAGMISDETSARIKSAVDELPPAQREVFLLRTEQELSFAEIAKMLDIPLNTALGRMHYAVTNLRKKLEDLK